MKQIATLTTHAALNYGAVLQAYALQRYIAFQGCRCDILNYVPAHVRKSYRLIQPPTSPQGLALAAFQALHYRSRKQRKDRFEAFRRESLSLSGGEFGSHRELIDTANRYDLILCGSDQIWSPALHNFDEGYFLSFPEVRTPRASYAASFGQDELDEKVIPELRRRLEGFSAFACRERTAQALIKELTGIDAPLVLDPVFLLNAEHWRTLASPVGTEASYCLSYFLSNPGQSPFALKRYARSIDGQVLSIGFSPRDPKCRIPRDYTLGPREFLSAVEGAQVVLTNSFHCTAFAIIFRKNFYTRISHLPGARNDRIVTLLRELGLEDRMYTDADAHKLDFSKPIDYDAVMPKLETILKRSRRWLDCIIRE